MLYLIIIGLLLINVYNYDYLKKKDGGDVTYFTFLLLFIIIAGLRYRIGVDSIRYENNYQTIPTIFDLSAKDIKESKFDPGYFLLSSIAKTISSNFIVLQFIQAIFVNVVIFRFFKKNTEHRFLALLIYFIFTYFNFMCEVMREACAVSCFILAYPYFEKKKWLKYYSLSILAILFHTSAIILLVLPLIYLPIINKIFTIGKYTIFLIIGCFIIGSLIRITFFDYLQAITIFERLQDKATLYANSDLSENVYNLNGILGIMILYVIYPLTALIILKRNRRYGYKPALVYMVILGSCMAIISIPIALFYRFNNYFILFMTIAISDISFNTLKLFKHKYKLSFLSWVIVIAPWLSLRSVDYFRKIEDTNLKEYQRYYPYESRVAPTKNEKRERLFDYYHTE